MLVHNMTLRQMVDFKPDDLDMAMLPLEVTVYIRVSIISLYKQDNYDFIRWFFSQDIRDDLYQMEKTVIYDFDGSDTKQERFVSVFELYAKPSCAQVTDHFKEVLEEYDHVADVVMDFFTHDNKTFRLSNLDGIVKLEELHSDGTKEEVKEPVKEEPKPAPVEEKKEEPKVDNKALADEIQQQAKYLDGLISAFEPMDMGLHHVSEEKAEEKITLETVEKPKEEEISLETVEKPEEKAPVLEAPETGKKEEPALQFEEEKKEETKDDEEKITLIF
ncbi:MAG: hypothetical protein IIZ33_05530 [Erysipelotrichaceae bacterium]|nr:hypothetical protein [Erysipelotrichaceae bacterium]